VAGLPLARDLLTYDVVVVSKQAERRFQAVWRDYYKWRTENLSRNPEEYLADLYENQRSWPPFSWAVELVAAVLATPRGYDAGSINPRYGIRITRPSQCGVYTAFWETISDTFDEIAVVTTNYDLLVERGLRHKPMKRVFGPGCYYGGLDRPQILKGTALPFTVKNPQRFVELTGKVPVYKLHGSLNWSRSSDGLELYQDVGMQLYQDMRPAFRHGGDAAIVPPIPEKKTPDWLKPVWEEAELRLSRTNCWVVCGYSLPDYDIAVQEMLKRASGSKLEKMFILDPYSEDLRDRYTQVALGVEIYCLAGLPDGIRGLRSAAISGLEHV